MDRIEVDSGNEQNDDCQKVYKRIAGVSLESDSLPETPSVNRTTRRKKRITRRQRGVEQMDVDVPPKSAPMSARRQLGMEWDGADAESHISSSDSFSEDDARGREGDDEQSDWQGYSAIDSDFDPCSSSDRRPKRSTAKTQMSQLQKRLERFALEGGKGEMGIEFKIRDRPNSADFSRMLLQYRLEIVKRQRGTVVLRRKNQNQSGSTS